jgi:hypothetical protein
MGNEQIETLEDAYDIVQSLLRAGIVVDSDLYECMRVLSAVLEINTQQSQES